MPTPCLSQSTGSKCLHPASFWMGWLHLDLTGQLRFPTSDLAIGSDHAVVPVPLVGCTCSQRPLLHLYQPKENCCVERLWLIDHVICVTQAEAHGETDFLLGPIGTNQTFQEVCQPRGHHPISLPLAQTGLSPPSIAWNSVENSV